MPYKDRKQGRLYARERHKRLRADPEYRAQRAANNRRRLYGLTREGWEWMLEQQGGVCATCDRPAEAVDHDHLDMSVRGLLCAGCNNAVMSIEKAERTARRIHNYVEASK